MDTKITEFLRESNAIENVWDKDSLQQAIYAWEFIIGKRTLTINNILKTHKILMLHQSLMPNEKGYFRTQQVWVGGEEKMRWEKIYLAVEEWCIHINDFIKLKEKDDVFKEGLIQEYHVEFENIHPFIDGNGRIGRILYQWQRIKVGLPILVISEKEKYKYYQWF